MIKLLSFLLRYLRGALLDAIYEILRILRKVVRHHIVVVNIEDFIYWNFVGVFLYIVIFISNNGILRWFIIAAAVGGAYLFHMSIGHIMVEIVSKILKYFINKVLKNNAKKVKIKMIVVYRLVKKTYRNRLLNRISKKEDFNEQITKYSRDYPCRRPRQTPAKGKRRCPQGDV